MNYWDNVKRVLFVASPLFSVINAAFFFSCIFVGRTYLFADRSCADNATCCIFHAIEKLYYRIEYCHRQ